MKKLNVFIKIINHRKIKILNKEVFKFNLIIFFKALSKINLRFILNNTN